jgi:hypothetical protein
MAEAGDQEIRLESLPRVCYLPCSLQINHPGGVYPQRYMDAGMTLKRH